MRYHCASTPVSFWDETSRALAHLGHPDPKGATLALSSARETTEGVPRALRDVRAYLDEHLVEPSLHDAALTLGLSSRTLQRRLLEERTSFVAEVQDARLRNAQRLLLNTDAAVTTIALNLGYASPQHFSSSFRKRMGITPAAFRAQRKRL
ncbi:MAG: hypothetical protein NVS3B20_25350 [Polyangiales bacterium]